MYTYERLYRLCGENSNESDIAHYLLKNSSSIARLSVKKIKEDLGISKSSLHRFYNSGGYSSFKNLISILNEEIENKKFIFKYSINYKENYSATPAVTIFNNRQIEIFIKKLSNTKHVVFYGNSFKIFFFKNLCQYLFYCDVDVSFLDIWNLNKVYSILENLKENDIFIMVETSWRIQGIYESSLNQSHIINLSIVNEYPFQKFYIGKADCDQYLNYYNINVPCKDEETASKSLKKLNYDLIKRLKMEVK